MAQLNHTPRLAQTEEAPLTVRRRLRSSRPPRWTLRIHKAACRLGGAYAGTLAATEGRGERTLLLARHTEVLLSPVPRGGWAAPFLVASAGEEAQALRMEPLRREILSEMVGDPETLLVDSTLLSVLHPLLRFLRAAQACVGQRGFAGVPSASTGEAAPHLCH
jgi:hypothetical protein